MSALELVTLDDDAAWDAGVAASAQGTVFASAAYLRALDLPTRRYAVRAGQRVVALLPAVLAAGPDSLAAPPYTPYQGPMFVHEPGLKPRQRVLDEFRIGEFLVAELAQRHRRIAMPLHWSFQDVRPFLWHNYHEAGAPRFAVTPRYTALLDLRTLDLEAYPAEVRACRRQELRKAAAHEVGSSTDLDGFMALYEQTFARQEIELGGDTLSLVRRIARGALDGGYGRLSACRTAQGLASMYLFLFDARRAYYLFAANDPAQRNSGAATRLMFDAIADARGRGLQELDFVGVNSPNRGDFKLSFSPELALYFDVALSS